MRDRRARAVVDAVGAALLALAIGSVFLAARHAGDPWPQVELLCASFAVVVAARLIGVVHRALVPAAIAVTGIVLAFTSSNIDGGALSGPFGYRNATGAFYVQAAVAALMVAAAVRRRWLRVGAVVVAIPFAAVAARDSWAAAASLVTIAIAAVGLRGSRPARAAVVAVGLLFVLVLSATVVLGAGYHRGGDAVFATALSERRLSLWRQSLQLVAHHPGGVGPGRFQDVDRIARRDRDARWAHEEFLQEGVEIGWAGMALVLLLFLWGFARLRMHPSPDLVVALGAASLAALGMHASVDYVLHFPAVPLTAVALVSTALAVPSRRSRHGHDDPRTEGLEGDAHPAGVALPPAAG